MKRVALVAVPCLLTVGGCATTRDYSRGPGPTYDQFAAQVKYEVATFLWRHRNDPEVSDYRTGQEPGADLSGFEADVRAGKLRMPTAAEVCPYQLNVTIKRIKLVATTSVENKVTGSAGVDLPIGPAVLSPAISGSRTKKTEATSTLTIDLVDDPMPMSEPKPVLDGQGNRVFADTVMADTIDAIAAGLAKSADRKPCFTFPQDDKAVNSIKWGVTYTNARTAGAKFKLIVFSLGADNTRTRTAANTIEVELTVSGGFR